MSDSLETLRQINTIRQAVLERSRIVPDDPRHYALWSLLSAIALCIPYWTPWIIHISPLPLQGTSIAILILLVSAGFLTTLKLCHRSIDQADMVLTKEFHLITALYLIVLIFGIIMTLFLLFSDLYFLINAVWMFCVGLGMFVEGHLVQRIYGHYGRTLTMMALITLSVTFLLYQNNPSPSYIALIQGFITLLALMTISIPYGYFGIKLSKQQAYV